MANRYKSRKKADQKHIDGGYKNVVNWTPVDVVTLAKPAPGLAPASGDSLRITTDHTFAAPLVDGWISWLCEQDSVTIKSKTVDKQLEHTAEFTLLGDDASTQEQLEDLIGDAPVFVFKDANCLVATDAVQLGDECKQPKVEVEFDGATTATGQKRYKVTLTVRKAKYFYSGAITAKP